MLRYFLFSLGIIGLNACSSWPDLGRGGMAEVRPVASVPVELNQSFHISRLRWNNLHLLGGSSCMPGRMQLLADDLNRTIREISGGLYQDAETNLLKLGYRLNKAEHQLSYLTDKTDCALVAQTVEHHYLHGGGFPFFVHFEKGSSTLSEAYLDILEHLTHQLESHPKLRIVLRGHTDQQGSDEDNLKLADQRVRSVRTALLNFSPSIKNRVTTFFSGEMRPLITSGSVFSEGLNRRVSVQLIADDQALDRDELLPVHRWEETLNGYYGDRIVVKAPFARSR